MKVSSDMRLSWLQRWQSMDEDGSNLLDYTEFLQACGLRDNIWSWRMFNLLDKNFVGVMEAYLGARGFVTAVNRRVAAAAQRQFQTMALAAASKKMQVLNGMSSIGNTTAKKIRRVASESSIGRHLNSGGNERPTVAKPGDVVMKRLKLWTTATSAVDSERPLTTRVERVRATLRRVVSDSDLGNIGKSERSAKFGESLTGARARWARSMSPAELSSSVKTASKRATKHLAESARDISQSGGAIRQLSARKMADTRGWLKVESEMLTEAAKGAARDLEKFGRLKAIATVAVARPDDETARKTGKRVGEAAKVGGEKALAALRRSFVAITAVRYFSEAVKDAARGGLRRQDQQRPTSANLGGDPDVADSGYGMLLGGDEDSEDSQRAREDDESEVPATAEEKLWDILTDAKAKAEVKVFQERHWAATEKFYENLVTATERLEEKKTKEKGKYSILNGIVGKKQFLNVTPCLPLRSGYEKRYDFSADFPKLWCVATMRDSQGERKIQYRRKRRSSASKKAANVFMCLGLDVNRQRKREQSTVWQVLASIQNNKLVLQQHQEAGDDSGRSKLAKAFNRWRLNTCDAAVDDLSGSLSTLSKGGRAASEESSTNAPRHIPSLMEMWESAAAAGEGEGTHLHAIIMKKVQADRPLPRELCEAYEREMVERIDRRQAENNVPIVPMPIC
ncbi:unnamed protein product [Ectocarpus sp. CCAP 1310/34]|nr:unnamed protein product [Ectocarpus sp. CCAP 1310/34]